MSADEYAPFPEQQLLSLVTFHETLAKIFKSQPGAAATHIDAAKTCRDAIAAHVAVRERCLIAETENNQLKRRAR